MNQLKKLIVKYFVLCAFGISVAESVIDSTFADLLMPAYADHETVGYLLVTCHLVLCILVFFLGAYLFYGLTKKAMEAESKRQMQEQNLLYSCIAHDLKTPMTSVQGFASALKDGKIKPEEIGAILESGNRTAAGPTVPPGGLYMSHLWYDNGIDVFECPGEGLTVNI